MTTKNKAIKATKSKHVRVAWQLPQCRGYIKVKAIKCGKPGCTKCPHEFFAYFIVKEPCKKAVETYLGKCDEKGFPRIGKQKRLF